MRLIPITSDATEMHHFIQHEFTKGAFEAWQKVYPLWGFHLPWVGYFVIQNDQVVGVGGFKGQPRNNTVEIAYGTVPEFEGKGIGSNTCRLLVECALNHAPDVRITARTLPEKSASTRILEKNNFEKSGTVNDADDGDVWFLWRGNLNN